MSQQRKISNKNECSRATKYSKSRESTLSFDGPQKQVYIIDSDGCGPPKNWKKNFRPPRPESENRTYDSKRDYTTPEAAIQAETEAGAKTRIDLCIACFTRDTDYWTRDCPIFLQTKKEMTQKHNQPPNPSTTKEVNHTPH
jgi:hypothetical protein